jgi:hypothetical protein
MFVDVVRDRQSRQERWGVVFQLFRIDNAYYSWQHHTLLSQSILGLFMTEMDSKSEANSEQEPKPLESATKPYVKPSFTEYFNIFDDAFAS